jgi:serine/threonine protein kinase/class 3 adenylate cyclase
MQLFSYQLDTILGVGPAGAIYLAHDPSGAQLEVRFLDQARNCPEHWDSLIKRFRLIQLVRNRLILQPIQLDLEHDPPYLIIPHLSIWKGALPKAIREKIALDLIECLVEIHRVGLTLGASAPLELLQRAEDQFSLDLTNTQRTGSAHLNDSQTNDIRRLGELLGQILDLDNSVSTRPLSFRHDWGSLISEMREASEERVLLAEDILKRLAQADPQQTVASEIASPMQTKVSSSMIAQAQYILDVGHSIGRFRLKEKLGEGATGFVFRAEDPLTGESVALKILKLNTILPEKVRLRFIKEGRILASIDTPYVTKLIEVNHDRGTPYIALEFVQGTNLAEVLQDGKPLAESLALRYIVDAARGLAAAHRLGIIHRDIKPANLLLTPEGRVKVTDFGLAREVDQSESMAITQDGSAMGTPLYMAPEQFSSNHLDPRADVYSLGATLFHMLAGRPPFQANRLPLLAQAVMKDPAPDLEKINPAVSGAVAAFVSQALSKSPDARPADAGDFLEQLERILKREPTPLDHHPLDPQGATNVKTYTFTWELKSSPARLWPYVSNTERLNKTIGLPSPTYKMVPQRGGGTKRLAWARAIGLSMEWEEFPFEWIEGKRMGILRQFHKGPFAWFLSIVELHPNNQGGTTLRHTIRVQSRGILGKLITPIQMGILSKKALGQVYKNIDSALCEDQPWVDPFEGMTQISSSRRRVLEQRIEELILKGASPKGTQILQYFLIHASAQEVARIRPLALAQRLKIDEEMMIDTCLRAVGVGILQLRWDVICPLCRVPSGRKNTLKELKEHEECPTCDQAFKIDFVSAVEMVFEVHPEIRQADNKLYCAGGPVHSPHLVAQIRLAPAERMELPLTLSEGNYRLRGPQLPWSAELRILPSAGLRRWEISLDNHSPERIPPLGVGAQNLILENNFPYEILLKVERTAARNDALTAHRAVTLPAFRELFPNEILSPGQLTPASLVTLAQIEVTSIEQILEKQGDAKAYELIYKGFEAISRLVKAEGGTVVKSVGDGLFVSFSELVAGVRSLLRLGEWAKQPDHQAIRFRAGLHRGFVMVTTLDERLDYFGLSVKLVSRLVQHAKPNELLLTTQCTSDAEVSALLENRPLQIIEIPQNNKPLLAVKVPLLS